MLKKGDIFPQFNLENQNGEVISNETIKGNKTVLYLSQASVVQVGVLSLG